MATIIGTDNNDVLFGSPGDDLLDAGASDDGMNGGPGNDTYLVRDWGDVVYEAPDQGVDTITVAFDYVLPDQVENLNLTLGISGIGNRQDNLIQANPLNNFLAGSRRNDVLYGFEGNDDLDGGSGNDRLYGGSGNDILTAGRGYDELFGGPGNDTYVVKGYAFKIVDRPGGPNDTLKIPVNYELVLPDVENLVLLGKAQYGTGDDRNNRIEGNKRSNGLSGLKGNDTILGNKGRDDLFGNEGNDELNGEEGDDQVYGQAGNDQLLGDRGNDELYGEGGRDILTGYGGGRTERDQMTGGEGNDVFVLGVKGVGGVHYLGSGFATITDFRRSEGDKIQLSGRLKNYRLVTRNVSGSSTPDTAIYRGNDLLAVVQDNPGLTTRDLIPTRATL